MRALALAVALLGLAVAACRRPPAGPVNPQAEVAVAVNNQNFLDMDVFIVRGTQRIRLGMVPGLSSRVLMVRPELIGYSQEVRFEVHPIGGLGDPGTDTVPTHPNDLPDRTKHAPH